MVNWATFCLCLAAPAAFALSAHAHGSRLRCPLRSPSSVQCHEQWPDDPHPEALAELPQGEEHPRAELPGAELLSRTLLNPKVDVALGIPVVVSASIFAVQTLALGGNIGGFYFSPLEVFNFLENVENSICIVFLIEYLLRWYASSLAPSYLVKPSAIIDLISFLPLLIQLMMDSQGSAVPDLAFLRLLRVLRLQRYLQDADAFNRFQLAVGVEQTEVRPYQLELARVGSSLLTLIFISTGSIYEAEHRVNEKIPDFFTALYFGLTTLTTVGFGDIYPITSEGRLVVCASIVVGVAVVPPQLLRLAEALSEGLGQRQANAALQRDAALRDAGASELPPRPNPMAACSNCGQAVHISTAVFCHQCGARLT